MIDPAYVWYGPWVNYSRDEPDCGHYLQHPYEADEDGLKTCMRCGRRSELPWEEAQAYRDLMGYFPMLRRMFGR